MRDAPPALCAKARKTNSGLTINFRSPLHKLYCLLFHTPLQCGLFIHALRGGVVAHFLRDFHGAKMGAAHGAEMRDLGGIFGQRFILKIARLVGVEAEIELVFPAEFEARFG